MWRRVLPTGSLTRTNTNSIVRNLERIAHKYCDTASDLRLIFFFSLTQIRAQEEIKPLIELCDSLNYVANVAMSRLQLTPTRVMTVETELFHEKSAIPIYRYACRQCVLFLQSHIIYQVFMYRETGLKLPLKLAHTTSL